jgi:hypothetical protein
MARLRGTARSNWTVAPSCQLHESSPHPTPSLKARISSRIWRVLTMVYETQNYWVSGLCPLSGILNTRKHNRWENRKTPAPLGPLERANFLLLEFRTMDKIQKTSNSGRSSRLHTVFTAGRECRGGLQKGGIQSCTRTKGQQWWIHRMFQKGLYNGIPNVAVWRV